MFTTDTPNKLCLLAQLMGAGMSAWSGWWCGQSWLRLLVYSGLVSCLMWPDGLGQEEVTGVPVARPREGLSWPLISLRSHHCWFGLVALSCDRTYFLSGFPSQLQGVAPSSAGAV